MTFRMADPVVEVIEEVPKKVSALSPRDIMFLLIGGALGWTAKHYRNVYLEWKRERLVSCFLLVRVIFFWFIV